MSRKKNTEELDTFLLGPTCCAAFDSAKDLCHGCVAGRLYARSICYVRPTGSVYTVKNEREQLQTAARILGEKT